MEKYQQAPEFKLPDQHNQIRTSDEFRGRWLVLYFYPKDDTPGCTKEACEFRDDFVTLTQMGAQICGISVDNSASHSKFTEKYHLPFPLLADKDGSVAKKYGALVNLVFFKFAKRYTFLIDPEGKIVKAYRKVDVSKHSKEIIEDLEKYCNCSA